MGMRISHEVELWMRSEEHEERTMLSGQTT